MIDMSECGTQGFFLKLHIMSSYSSKPHLINADGILPSSTNTNPLKFHSNCVIQEVHRSSVLRAMKIENTKFPLLTQK